MKIQTECSCGAKLALETDAGALHSRATIDATRADKLLENFRRDHKLCVAKAKPRRALPKAPA